jgi:hypothetical protein
MTLFGRERSFVKEVGGYKIWNFMGTTAYE